MRLTRFLPVVAVSVLTCNAAVLSSNFDDGTDGWTIGELFNTNHGVGPSYVSAAGLSGGYILTGDIYGFNAFRAPSSWLGDQSAFFGGSMTLSQRVLASDDIAYPVVVIGSGSTRLQFRAAPPGTDWTTYVIPFRADAGWELADGKGNPGATATDAQLQAALSNVDWIGINADWRTGYDLVGLDEVRISTIQPSVHVVSNPEPSTVMSVVSGLLAAVVLKRRR